MTWNSPFLTTLASLKIDTLWAPKEVTMAEFIFAFGNMPHIQTLELSAVIPLPPLDDKTHVPPNLSYLTYLRILLPPLECAYILNHLTFPLTTSIKLVCISDSLNDDRIGFDDTTSFLIFVSGCALASAITSPSILWCWNAPYLPHV
jgi:hypothetical protein